tara:strand:+ start:3555 stop:4463 length:909 start_codon:yes stop_codon:yes gene_type:complete
MRKVLVYGATGDQGHPLMRRLIDAGLEVRIATRNPQSFSGGEFSEVEAVYADFNDQASLIAASKGVDGIAMNLPFVFDVDYARHMANAILTAAVQENVKKVVFNTSCVVMDHDLDLSAHDGRRAIEAEIEKSGLSYAVIRSTVFMDNMSRAWVKPSIVTKDVFAYPASETLKVSWVCLDDVAKCMVAALSDPAIKAEKIMVGGPEALTGFEVAAMLSKELGREITFKSLEPINFAKSMSKLVTGSEVIQPGSVYLGMSKFYAWYNACETSPLIADASIVQEKLGVKLTPFSDWLKRIDWSAV